MVAMVRINIELDNSENPYADGRARRIAREGVGRIVERLALQGEAFTKEQMYPGHGVATGHLRRNVSGRRLGATLTGVVDFTGGVGREVVYAPYVNDRYDLLDNTVRRLEQVSVDRMVEEEIVRRL